MSGMIIPVVPQLNAGHVATSTELNSIGAACTFLLTKPLTQVTATVSGRALSVTPVSSAVQFDAANFDTDGMWNVSNPQQLTIQTPGWYKARYVVVASVGFAINAWIVATNGSNNPAGVGSQHPGGFIPGYTYNTTAGGPNQGCTASGVWPFYLYAGDYLQVFASASAAVNTQITPMGSTFTLEYVST